MTETSVATAIKKSTAGALTFVAGQVDRQIYAFGEQLHATSGSIRALADHARQDPSIELTAPLIERAGIALDRAAAYFRSRKADELTRDLETFGRRRPLAATLAAAVAGFTVSRALKASSTRRFDRDDERREGR